MKREKIERRLKSMPKKYSLRWRFEILAANTGKEIPRPF